MRRMQTTLTFTLSDPPPSINQSQTIRDRQIRKTAKHKSWRKKAEIELLTQQGIPDELTLYWSAIYYLPRDVARYDVGNATKATTDLLVACGKVPDDRYLVDERVRFVETGPFRLAVTIEELAKWQTIMKPSRSLLRRLEKSYLSASGLL